MTLFETVSIIGSLIGCTWYIGQKMNTFVTHEVCTRRRQECPCRRDIHKIKHALNPSNPTSTDLIPTEDLSDLN